MSSPQTVLTIVFSALIGQAAIGAAQTTGESDAVAISSLTTRVEAFFGFLKSPNVNAEDAFADLLAGGPLSRVEQRSAMVESYKKLEATYGRFLVAKQVHVKRVGEDLIFLTFLYESERFPVVWRFAFYRPPLDTLERPDWFVVRLSFDTKLEQLASLP